METDFVKWGARQITKDEFIRISMLYIARGIAVTGWSSHSGIFSEDIQGGRGQSSAAQVSGGPGAGIGKWGTSGLMNKSSNSGVTTWTFDYRNYRDALKTYGDEWVTFVTIHGKVWAGSSASSRPTRYGEDGWVTITGPAETPHLYSGKIILGSNKTNITSGSDNGFFNWNGSPNNNVITSRIAVEYPSGTTAVNIPYRGSNTPLIYVDQDNFRWDKAPWK
jgi:hypothetical protein